MQQYGNAAGLTAVLAGPFGSAGTSAKLTQVHLPAAEWKGAISPYFQNVVIDGISENTLVTLQAEGEQIAYLGENGIALSIDNDGGITTAYAIGAKPAVDLILQVCLLEVVQV